MFKTKKNQMKTITITDIRAMNPCYDPNKYLKEDFNGTLVDVLENKKIPPKDRLWVCVRHTLLTDKQLHLYGLACARMSEKYTTDERVKQCNDVVERFINGKATNKELSAARSAAESAALAAESAARYAALAAESAARSAARSAALAAAESAALAAESAARSAARSAALAALAAALAARSAAESAAESAALAAALAAESAAAVEENQCKALIKILKDNE